MQAEQADQRLPHVLILDEMNRTDLSRMLGECFSLLENRDRPVRLPGTDGNGREMTLWLPPDLYVIGTMNLLAAAGEASSPVRKVYYNVAVTGLSVAVALSTPLTYTLMVLPEIVAGPDTIA